MKKDTTLEKVNELIKELPGYIQVEGVDTIDAKMRYGLAQAYANEGFRKYLEFAIRFQDKAVDNITTQEDLYFLKGRKLLLKEFYGLCKKSFEEAAKIEAKSKEGSTFDK